MSPDDIVGDGRNRVGVARQAETAYGLISRLRDPGGASRPTTVAASDDWKSARCPSARGNLREEGRFVLPPVDPARVEAPDLRASRAVAKRLERDRQLHRPAAFEAADGQIPDRIPVGVELPLVGDLPVPASADRVDRELETVAAIVESVDEERDVIVLEDVVVVATHLVGHECVRPALPASERHVDGVVVEEEPAFGFLRRNLTFHRLHLEEVSERGRRRVDGFIELTIELDRRGQSYGSQRGAAVRIARDDARRHGHRWAVEREWEIRSPA